MYVIKASFFQLLESENQVWVPGQLQPGNRFLKWVMLQIPG